MDNKDSHNDLNLNEIVEHSDANAANHRTGKENTLFNVISSYRRRIAILIFDKLKDDTYTTRYISEVIAKIEYDEYNSKNRKNVYVGLYQHHLDIFNDINAINYNKDRNILTINKEIITPLADYVKYGYNITDEIDNNKNEDIDEKIKSAIAPENREKNTIDKIKSILEDY